MKSKISPEFRKLLKGLPKDAQNQALNAYRFFKVNPYHPSLHFKCIDSEEQLYSVRVGNHYRALGIRDDDVIAWFWIGTHESYNKLIKR